MDWQEAQGYGLIDRVLEQRGEAVTNPPAKP
jgi:ATP-dependent protease ClpP protease subunit